MNRQRRQAQDKPSRGRGVVDVDPDAAVRKTARTGALSITVFWLAILAVTYAGFTYYANAKSARFKP